jgi:hypothetical protein
MKREGRKDVDEKGRVDEEAEEEFRKVEERGWLVGDGDGDGDSHEDGEDDDESASEDSEHGGKKLLSSVLPHQRKKKRQNKKKKHRLLSFIKGTTKAGVGAILKTDEIKAKLGSGTAKNRLGLIKEAVGQNPRGPVEFTARFEGKKGRVVLVGSGMPMNAAPGGGGVFEGGSPTKGGYDLSGPILRFTTTFRLKSLSLSDPNSTADVDVNDPGVLWTLPIHTIREIRKISGLGWKGKLVVGWSMGRTIADGIEIVDMDGREWRCTAMELRDVSLFPFSFDTSRTFLFLFPFHSTPWLLSVFRSYCCHFAPCYRPSTFSPGPCRAGNTISIWRKWGVL